MFILEKALNEIFQPKRKAGENYYLTRADLAGVDLSADFAHAKSAFFALRKYILRKQFEYHLLIILDNGVVKGAIETTSRHKSQAFFFGQSLRTQVGPEELKDLKVKGLLKGDPGSTYSDIISGKQVVSLHNHPMDSDMRKKLMSGYMSMVMWSSVSRKFQPSDKDKVALETLQREFSKYDCTVLAFHVLTPLTCYTMKPSGKDELYVDPVRLRMLFADSPDFDLIDFPLQNTEAWVRALSGMPNIYDTNGFYLLATRQKALTPELFDSPYVRNLGEYRQTRDQRVFQDFAEIIRSKLHSWYILMEGEKFILFTSTVGSGGSEYEMYDGLTFMKQMKSIMDAFNQKNPDDGSFNEQFLGAVYNGYSVAVVSSIDELNSGKATVYDKSSGESEETQFLSK